MASLEFVRPKYQRQLPPFVANVFVGLKACARGFHEASRTFKTTGMSVTGWTGSSNRFCYHNDLATIVTRIACVWFTGGVPHIKEDEHTIPSVSTGSLLENFRCTVFREQLTRVYVPSR